MKVLLLLLKCRVLIFVHLLKQKKLQSNIKKMEAIY